MAITVKCDFCDYVSENPNFLKNGDVGDKDGLLIHNDDGIIICEECVSFCVKIIDERDENKAKKQEKEDEKSD